MASKGNRRGKRHRRARAVREADERFGPDQSVTVHTFPDGWTIRHAQTINDQWREGTLMKNCLQDQKDLVAMAGDRAHEFTGLTDETVYSLRDPSNFPHVTIEMSMGGNAYPWGAAQAFPPKDEYLARVLEWIATLDDPPQLVSPWIDDDWTPDAGRLHQAR